MYGPETYGERNTDVYDEWHADLDPTNAVQCLADLITHGPAGRSSNWPSAPG